MATVKGRLKEKYTVENSTRTHTWLVDEPIEVGGLDLAQNPKEQLLSALVSCKTITVKMYANRKGWDVKNVFIELTLAEQVGDKTIIEKSIRFEGELDEDQTKRLIDISGRCPVVKLLANSFEYRIV